MASLLLALIYLCFISLGLPDSLLGSAWPTLYPQMNIPVSFMGIITFIICLGTIVSSLLSDRISRKIGAGTLTASSILLTALGLLGFSLSHEFWHLILWSIPYGLGAGGVDSVLNNYVALHFKAKHMSWLHCMWGIGAFISPNIMSYALSYHSWNHGYFVVFLIQIVLSVIVFASLPLWKRMESQENRLKKEEEVPIKPLGIIGSLKLKGAIFVFLAFFCYCAIEQTFLYWAASYYVLELNIDEKSAASLASLGYLGIMVGRFVNGFLTMKFKDRTLIRIGSGIILAGILLMVLPFGKTVSLIAFFVIGLGCAPIYPSIVHSTPALFGKANSQAMIGVQMAFAYTANLIMSPLFGVITDNIGAFLLPYYLLFFLVIMIVLYEITLHIRDHIPSIDK